MGLGLIENGVVRGYFRNTVDVVWRGKSIYMKKYCSFDKMLFTHVGDGGSF